MPRYTRSRIESFVAETLRSIAHLSESSTTCIFYDKDDPKAFSARWGSRAEFDTLAGTIIRDSRFEKEQTMALLEMIAGEKFDERGGGKLDVHDEKEERERVEERGKAPTEKTCCGLYYSLEFKKPLEQSWAEITLETGDDGSGYARLEGSKEVEGTDNPVGVVELTKEHST